MIGISYSILVWLIIFGLNFFFGLIAAWKPKVGFFIGVGLIVLLVVMSIALLGTGEGLDFQSPWYHYVGVIVFTLLGQSSGKIAYENYKDMQKKA